jgi:hypothetical protein
MNDLVTAEATSKSMTLIVINQQQELQKMAAGEIYQATIEGKLDGQITNNVMHFRGTNNITGSEQSLADSVLDCVLTTLLPGLSNEFHIDRVRVRRILPTAGNEVTAEAPGNSLGATTGSLPSFNAAVLSLRSANGSKSGRGRMFIAGIPTGGEAASQVSDTLQTTLVAFIACLAGKFISGLSTSGMEWGVLSRKNYAANPSTESSWWNAITSVLVNDAIGTMRSRKLKHGS